MSEQFTLDQGSQLLSDWIRLHPDELKLKNAALERYGKYFAPENLDAVTAEGFREFLSFKNNQHWGHIQRHPEIYANEKRLRECLKLLLNEDEPIETRLNKIIPKDGPPFIKSLNRAVLTPILMCVYPDKYAVYNRRSEDGLTWLGLNRAKAKDSFGERYVAINEACNEIKNEIKRPFELVDLMFGLMIGELESTPNALTNTTRSTKLADDDLDSLQSDPQIEFPLEEFLERFLVANWGKIPLGETLELYKENKEDEADGARQYDTHGMGKIDILARDKHTHEWVVIELKKGKSSDAVVGQLLRYMGWVKNSMPNGEKVRGIIITSTPDDRIKSAMSVAPGISFYTYNVQFQLNEHHAIGAKSASKAATPS